MTKSKKPSGSEPKPTSLEDGQPDKPGDSSPAERDEVSQQNAIFAKLSGERLSGGFIEINRRSINETTHSFLDNMPVENYVEGGGKNILKTVYGGGDYRLVAKSSRGVIVTSWSEKIDLLIPAKHPSMAAAAEPKSDFTSAIKELKDMMKPFLDKALAPPPAPVESGLKELMPVISAALARPEPRQDNEMFKLILEMQAKAEQRTERLLEKFAEKSEKGGRLKDQVEDLLALREAFESDAPAEKKNELIELVKALAPALLPLIQHGLANGAGMPAPILEPQPQITERSATVTPQPKPDDSMNPQMSFILQNFRRSAIEAARNGEEAIEFATGVLRFVPPDMLPRVFGIANADDWYTQIFKDDPEAMKFLEFMTAMRNAILARSVVFVAKAQKKANTEAANTAKSIVTSLNKTFHNYLYNETDPDNWTELFSDSGIDAAWLEQLRVALDALLNGDAGAAAEDAGAKTTGT